MFKDYNDLIKQMEYEMQRSTSDAMKRLLAMPSNTQEFWLPRADVYETDDELVIRIEAAGVKKESFNVSLSADRRILNVKGVRQECEVDTRKKIKFHQLEVYFGMFERDVLLPTDFQIDETKLSAVYKEGFLIVTLPKLKETQITRSVEIADE